MHVKGVNLGGWLLMEGYILGGRNIPEGIFKEEFKKRYGQKGVETFEHHFRRWFIREEDIKNIASLGAGAVRLPFHYRLVEKKPFSYSQEGLSYLKDILSWAEKYGIGVILDLHAACGAQNGDWHADSRGEALLWRDKKYRERTVALWEVIADQCKGYPSLIGYDILNEPVIGETKETALLKLYKRIIQRIRAVDKRHRIFLEGNHWATDTRPLAPLIEENVSLSIHYYVPLDYVFGFVPFSRFPGAVHKEYWDEGKVRRSLEVYHAFATRYKTSVFVGEFGINWRGGGWGELAWLEAVLGAFDELGFEYTYWTYKASAHSVFPSGLYQYIDNSSCIRRGNPYCGWESYFSLWRNEQEKIIKFWHSKNWVPNTSVIEVLEEHFKR